MNTIRFNKAGVKMIAHRGLSGIEKENTTLAFTAAANRSYFGIETDVHPTADGRYILIHDESTRRVSGDALEVEKSTYSTLRGLYLTDTDGSRTRNDLRLPSLEEYLGICKKYEKAAILELKNPMRREQVLEIMQTVKAFGMLGDITVISFSLQNLIFLREEYPLVPAQYLLFTFPEKGEDILSAYRLGLDIKHTALTKEIVDKVHALGLPVNVWTVNDPKRAEELVLMGVDMITTNILE